MIVRNIGDEVKFQEWHYGKIIEINGNLATVKTSTGITVIKDIAELRTNKQIPKYIDFWGNRYRVRIKGKLIGYFVTQKEAVKARDKYLKEVK